MELKNILEDQMATPLWFFRFPPPLIVILAPLLILVGLILGFSFYSIFLTSIALILSTIFFTCSKQKPVLLEKLVEEEVVLKSDNGSAATQEKEVQEASTNSEASKYLAAPQSSTPDLVAESACLDDLSSSGDSEVLDWPFGDNVDRSPDCSDGSISDEESLIEISLSGEYYVDHDKEEESIFSLQQKMSGLSQKAIFQQHTLFEFLAEINEEENMIEIDISMGSIKCSRFEIEA
ncbi:PREDICTED: uncharacterized protein LOC101308692 [Fragaria vesca subsp. vesca]|uniref:uncharacterized protein LOC101308692 n=1 Tax=Fragaria vesca subsp. vesca TaxID=101020 RepID=UPI0002C2FF4E|nr:PREDICTED: uncharacterized protein LOC101308692 [Fragaria vesca subsp. vesca]XP_011467304.1 PREDICTED: uncharacterized protein LOC101308692 [Fragaria vesca subsp. vesca]